MPTVHLSGFADEISNDAQEQIDALVRNRVHHIELRGVWGAGVLDLSPTQIQDFRTMLADAGIGVSAIGSPIGKVSIRSDLDAHYQLFQLAVERAHDFTTPYVRVFSFYHPDEEAESCRESVLEQMRRMTEYAATAGIVLLHENEKGIYGDIPSRCRDLLESVGHPNLRATFDPANFIQSGSSPRQQAWPDLSEYVTYFHIKDAVSASGRVVPAGHGDASMGWILQEACARGFAGYLSLEPHLKADDPDYGGDGAERFGKAVAALRELLEGIGVQVIPCAS
jgi:3-dehydroshikimate dehydratase